MQQLKTYICVQSIIHSKNKFFGQGIFAQFCIFKNSMSLFSNVESLYCILELHVCISCKPVSCGFSTNILFGQSETHSSPLMSRSRDINK